jgi:hypothetical protein
MDSILQTLSVFVISLSVLLFFGPIMVIVAIIGNVQLGPMHINLSDRTTNARVGLGSWLALYIPLVSLASRSMLIENPNPILEPSAPIVPQSTETQVAQYLPTATQILLPTETLVASLSTKWYVKVYNIDDLGTAYVNDYEITTVGYLGDSGWIDVTSYFSPDTQNRIRFTLENKGTGYHWGFAIKKNNFVIWQDEEGGFSQGARDNDQSHPDQIVYDKTLLISLDEQITELP